MTDPAYLQLHSTRAWSVEVEDLDGWTLRASSGFSHRGNSAIPIGHGDTAKVAAVEAWYQARGLPPYFQITTGIPGVEELTVVLRDRGYTEDEQGRSHILVADIPTDPSPVDVPDRFALTLRSEPSVTPDWIDRWLGMLGPIDPTDRERVRTLLDAATCPAQMFVTAVSRDEAVGVSYGAVEGDWLGLYCVVTDPSVRRRGFARRTIAHTMAWGRAEGATRAYLQVEADNAPALALYEQLGFRHAADYSYFRAPSVPRTT